MSRNIAVILFCFLLALTGCKSGNTSVHLTNQQVNQTDVKNVSPGAATSSGNQNGKTENKDSAAKNELKNVREYFNQLPQKYFLLEGCEPAKDKDCVKARAEYVKDYLEVEDIPNGYLKGGCDGAQHCLEMALFKRPDGKYLVGLNTYGDEVNDYYFLDYNNGNWRDISSEAVPEFSKKNIYVIPQKGTTVEVFAKKQTSEKGEKLYDLVWKDGKFSKK